MVADDLAAFVAFAEPAAIRRRAGLNWISVVDGVAEQTMDAPPSMCEEDGRPCLGAIALLVDSTVGMAAADAKVGGVTLSLRIDLARRFNDGQITARGQRLIREGGHAIGVGDLYDCEGLLGHASLRALAGFLGRDDSATLRPIVDRAPALVPMTTSVDEALQVETEGRLEGWARVSVPAHPGLASGHGKLHGGAIAVVADRGFRALLDDVAHEPMTFDIEYLRPIPCDGRRVAVEAQVASSSRRFVRASANVLLPDGRVAATARLVVEAH